MAGPSAYEAFVALQGDRIASAQRRCLARHAYEPEQTTYLFTAIPTLWPTLNVRQIAGPINRSDFTWRPGLGSGEGQSIALAAQLRQPYSGDKPRRMGRPVFSLVGKGAS